MWHTAELTLYGFFIVLGLVTTVLSWMKGKREFYSDTLFLIPMGIFVWGDGMILGPFWLLSGLVFWLSGAPLELMLRFFFLFKMVRSAYEVIYWINHQVAQKDYRPPLFRSLEWIGPNEAGILYQLINMCWAIVWGFLFVSSL